MNLFSVESKKQFYDQISSSYPFMSSVFIKKHIHARTRALFLFLPLPLSPCLSLTVTFQHCLAFSHVHKICEQRISASSYVCPYPQETTCFSEILYGPFLRKSDHHSQIW